MSYALVVVLVGSVLQLCSAGWRHRQFPRTESAEQATAAYVATTASIKALDEHMAVTPGIVAVVAHQTIPVGSGEPSHLDLTFEHALRESEAVVAALREHDVGAWTTDRGAAVPLRMLRAESGLQQAVEASPEGKARVEKMVGLAARLYSHARWLAERQQAKGAEQRYRASADWGQRAGRVALATHSLSRLGYFLTVWGRDEEAKHVLLETVQLGEKVPQSQAAHTASYLLGALQRRDAIFAGDADALTAADVRILAVEKLPSTDMEAERCRLTGNINYWHAAEASPKKCFDTNEAAHIAICLCSHLFRAAHQALV